jgi:hypothetical protein
MHARSHKRKQERLSLVTLVKHEDDQPYLELEHEQCQSVKSRETERERKRGGESLSLPISSEIKLYLSAPACRAVILIHHSSLCRLMNLQTQEQTPTCRKDIYVLSHQLHPL